MNTPVHSNRLLFVGDTVCDRSFHIGAQLKAICKAHDLCVLNLEGAFSSQRQPLFKAGVNLLLETAHFRPFSECFNVAVLANNHAMDYGVEGLDATRLQCQQHGLRTVGAGLNKQQAFLPLDGGACRIIAVGEHEFGAAGDQTAGIATVDDEIAIYRAIQEARRDDKFVIVVSHGGTEFLSFPPPYLRRRYKLWVEFGADMIIGNHPHVVQGFESYQGKLIFYSLGNFAFIRETFGCFEDTDWSIAVSVDTVRKDVSVIPIKTDKDGTLEASFAPAYTERFNRLSALIVSDAYEAMYRKACRDLFSQWYARLEPTTQKDAAILLHYFRCDAHKHMIATALSCAIGEVDVSQDAAERVAPASD